MGDEIACSVRFDEKNHISFSEIFRSCYDLAIAGLLLRVMRKLNAMTGKNRYKQPGTIHAFHCGTAHAVRDAEILPGSTDDFIRSDIMGIYDFFNARADKIVHLLLFSRGAYVVK